MATKKYKLKTRFEDFYVEERQELDLVENGQYIIFKLEKQGMDTVSALRITAKYLRVALTNIGFSGLKDRYSCSTQYISVPARELGRKFQPGETQNIGEFLNLTYIGRAARPLQLGDHTSNFFRLTIRRLNPENLALLKQNLRLLKSGSWIPNYFDSQRFGFLKGPEGFFAGAYLRGEFEDALKMVIANPNRKERPRSKTVHKFISDNWKNWGACANFLSENRFENYLDIITYLEREPADFHGAIKMLSADEMKLKIVSLQAYLWNEYLRLIIEDIGYDMEFSEIKYHVGSLLFPVHIEAFRDADKKIKDLIPETGEPDEIPALPLPSPDLEEPYRAQYNALLERGFGVGEISEFERFNELNQRTNSYRRPLIFRPDHLVLEEEGRDKNIDRKKNWYCTLSFELQPGSYATVMIKALMLA